MQDTLQQFKYLDRCQATTGWTVLGNDTTTLATTTRCIHGSAALEFDKVDGAANTKLAGIQITLSSVDFNDPGGSYDFNPLDVLNWWVYVSSLANVDYTFVRIGNSSSAYVEYRYQDDEMTAGRFTHCAVALAEYEASASTRIDWDDVDYMAVGVAFDAETDALADIAIGAIAVSPASWSGNSVSFGDVDAEVTLDSEGIPDAVAPSHALQVGAVANAAAPTPDEGDMGALSMTLTSELRTRLDLAQAVPDAAAPAQAVQVGAVANAAAPTPDEGDIGALSVDLNSQLRTRIDTAQAAHDAAAPADAVMAGAVANAAADTPDEGDISRLSMNLASELRTRTDSVQAASGAAAPSEMVAVGVRAESTVPTAVDDGDIVSPTADLYGYQQMAGYDHDNDAGRVVDVAPAVSQKLGPLTFTQLTAAGSTASTNVSNYKHLTWQIVVAAIDTNVVVRCEGSMDDSNWFNLDDSGVDTTYTSNGTYSLRASNRAVKYVRFTFVSEAGGANATIDVDLMAGN